jgi:hypothetical protein
VNLQHVVIEPTGDCYRLRHIEPWAPVAQVNEAGDGMVFCAVCTLEYRRAVKAGEDGDAAVLALRSQGAS